MTNSQTKSNDWEDVKAELLKDTATNRSYHKLDVRYSISKWWTNMLIKIRSKL